MVARVSMVRSFILRGLVVVGSDGIVDALK